MKNPATKKSTVSYDILGISTATLCLIHCMIFPLLTILPIGLSDNCIIDVLFAMIGLVIVSKIVMSNASKQIKIILAGSMLLVVTNVVLEAVFNIHSALLFIGGFGMIIGHFLNFKAHRNT
ncbi:MerC domain-containing protein [Flavobacterium sp. 7A]|uniref:MerC domain-containing protein n=1 Tax=Flavobacterium sp. 7A TaxID=2940571 RepID=UPI002226B7D7|nr:MerC domain-containing protein [Flavobacterium sp. 7A]MCW2119311.1 hypothetical protein [Flavobacterium sp. 7A]